MVWDHLPESGEPTSGHTPRKNVTLPPPKATNVQHHLAKGRPSGTSSLLCAGTINRSDLI